MPSGLELETLKRELQNRLNHRELVPFSVSAIIYLGISVGGWWIIKALKRKDEANGKVKLQALGIP